MNNILKPNKKSFLFEKMIFSCIMSLGMFLIIFVPGSFLIKMNESGSYTILFLVAFLIAIVFLAIKYFLVSIQYKKREYIIEEHKLIEKSGTI